MLQHALGDVVGARAILDNLCWIPERRSIVSSISSRFFGSSTASARRLLQFVEELGRERGEFIDEISGFLISWAIPAVNWPSAAIFCG